MTVKHPKKTGQLIIARHHESDWNKLGIWTGSRDVHITERGYLMSEEMGKIIKDIKIDEAFVSNQIRSYETLLGIEEALNIFNLPVTFSSALNERDYGEYTGKNKAEVERLIGADAFKQLRRGWDYPVPGGETLKMVYERIVPYYIETIVPKVLSGENVLIVSHGNTIRSLMKYIEGLPDEEMQNLEMLFGNFLIYEINKKGLMTKKEMRESPQPLKS